MTTMRCPNCDGTESVLATDGATAMCAECPGMSGDGTEMEMFDDEVPSDEPVNLHTVMSADAPTLRGIALELMGERDTLTASRDAAAQSLDDLVARVWRAAMGDTHEDPASVEVLLAAVEELRREKDQARVALRELTDAMTSVRRALPCRASRGDGECNWKQCPQEHDGRANYRSVCPLYVEPEEH